jgi:hypothetical protein
MALLPVLAEVGKIIYVKGDVFLLRDKELKPAIVGMKLQEKDTLNTKKGSLAKLLLADKSAISIGSNSEFSIEKYLYGEKKNSVARFKARKGVFRVITGKIAKISPDKFKLKTKTVTIGIRGTIFSGIIEKKNERFFCEKGAIYVSSQGVVQNVDKGFMSSVTPGQAPTKPRRYKKDDIQKVRDETSGWKDKKCED